MRIRVLEPFLLACVLLLASQICDAQSTPDSKLHQGVVIEKVTCMNDASQSYALYLPTNYTPQKQWPALYIFDPFAQGKAPVEIFHEAAEKFGFIVIGSNNSQNNIGGEKLSEIINAFWKDTHARFNIDPKRVYAAGLSGGARSANYFAISCNRCIAGVIASGATFPPKFPLDKPLPYSVFGTVGVDDLNFPELIKTFEVLKENGTTNHLAVFNGRHQWLIKDLTFDALEWLNLQAMKSGQLTMETKFVEDLLQKHLSRAESHFQNGNILEAGRAYQAIVLDFKDIADTTQAEKKFSEIRSQKSYEKAIADERRSFDEQQRVAKKIFSMGAELLDSRTTNVALQKVSMEIEGWRKKSKASVDSADRRLARRILGQVFVEAYETALYVNRQQHDYATMIANLELVRLINPQNSNTLLELARALALGKRKKDALETLERAINNGFSDCSQINGKPEWETLRSNKEFQKVIEKLNCKGPKS
jgi:tetratricopeptide (TPR) repeat protein